MQKISLYLIPLFFLISFTMGCQEEKEYLINESSTLLEADNFDPYQKLTLRKIKKSGNFLSSYSGSSTCGAKGDRSKPDDLLFSLRASMSNVNSISDQSGWDEVNNKVKEQHSLYVNKLDHENRNCRDIQLITLIVLDKLYAKSFEEYYDVEDQLSYVNLLIDLDNEDYDELAQHIDAMHGKIPTENFVRFIDYLQPKTALVIDSYPVLEKELKAAVESAENDDEKIEHLLYYSIQYTKFKSAEYAISLLEKYTIN